MSEEFSYALGYYEGVRNALLFLTEYLVRYESDGVVELQLNSEEFFTALQAELLMAHDAKCQHEEGGVN